MYLLKNINKIINMNTQIGTTGIDTCYGCPALNTKRESTDLAHKCGEGVWEGTKRTEFNNHPTPGLDCPHSR